jgi:hypothetical protein
MIIKKALIHWMALSFLAEFTDWVMVEGSAAVQKNSELKIK